MPSCIFVSCRVMRGPIWSRHKQFRFHPNIFVLLFSKVVLSASRRSLWSPQYYSAISPFCCNVWDTWEHFRAENLLTSCHLEAPTSTYPPMATFITSTTHLWYQLNDKTIFALTCSLFVWLLFVYSCLKSRFYSLCCLFLNFLSMWIINMHLLYPHK